MTQRRSSATPATPTPRAPPAHLGDVPAAAGAATFAPRLLAWFDVHGRHDLPWQQPRTPYRVWVSEVMLQQTQVATVIPYFERFLARFPDARALSDAPIDEVLHLWSGLGYYARARNLHRAARILCEEYAGELPLGVAALESLPGVGRSTAAAIAALSRDERHAILDGNVKRVLARWGGVEGYPGEATVAARLWALSDAVTPPTRCADFVQAIMDLGATLCTRARPACERCPIAEDCVARRTSRVGELPGPRPRRERPSRSVYWLVVRRGAEVLLERRPEAGVWGGLWGFPEFASRALAEAAWQSAAARGERAGSLREAPVIDHAFTHFDLRITPLVAESPAPGSAIAADAAQQWYNSSTPARLGLATPVAALLDELARGGD